MADLLSAASLLLTVLTILYSLWYPEISAASRSNVDRYSANRKIAHREARTIFVAKALPLCLATLALFLATVPPVLAIVHRPFARDVDSYDAVATIFVAVAAVFLFLSGHTLNAAWQLGKQVWKLNPKRGDY